MEQLLPPPGLVHHIGRPQSFKTRLGFGNGFEESAFDLDSPGTGFSSLGLPKHEPRKGENGILSLGLLEPVEIGEAIVGDQCRAVDAAGNHNEAVKP